MKFIVYAGADATLDMAIIGAVAREVSQLPLSPEAKALEAIARAEKITVLCCKWFDEDQCLSVEIDTEAETCRVLPL